MIGVHKFFFSTWHHSYDVEGRRPDHVSLHLEILTQRGMAHSAMIEEGWNHKLLPVIGAGWIAVWVVFFDQLSWIPIG